MSEQGNDRELVLTRIIDAPREKLFRAWTEPKLMEQWFCPKPLYVSDVKLDLRAGGASSMFINGPNGERFPNRGVYLDVVPNERIVFTDALREAWKPSEKPFFTVIVTFEDEGKTRYDRRARAALDGGRSRAAREDGFPRGMGKAADQLAELAATLWKRAFTFSRRPAMVVKNTICLWYDGEAEGCALLRRHFPDTVVNSVHRAPGDNPRARPRCPDGGVHIARIVVHRPQRRPDVQTQRSLLVPGRDG